MCHCGFPTFVSSHLISSFVLTDSKSGKEEGQQACAATNALLDEMALRFKDINPFAKYAPGRWMAGRRALKFVDNKIWEHIIKEQSDRDDDDDAIEAEQNPPHLQQQDKDHAGKESDNSAAASANKNAGKKNQKKKRVEEMSLLDYLLDASSEEADPEQRLTSLELRVRVNIIGHARNNM